MIVLFAPDSFKGSLTSVQVARALADGWLRARPDDETLLCPLADGGEGTLEAAAAAGGDWDWRTADVLGMDFDRCLARWLLSADGSRAVVELAQSSGLSLVTPQSGDVMIRATYGTGEVLKAVIDGDVRHITLGIGGSATNDGGCGLLEALGARVLNLDGKPLITEGTPTPPMVIGVDPVRVDLAGLDHRLADVDLQVACDVSNPLLGPTGATATYGPQKGATRKDRQILEWALESWADALEAATGRRERDTPGAGAAGGVGFGLLAIQDAFHSFALRPGVDLIMEATDFAARLARADLVITGEGRIDAQTAFGKTALGVARRAQAAGTLCIAVGGSVEPEGIAALEAVGATAIPVWPSRVPLEVALAAGAAALEACGERLAREFDQVG